ncbi:MULTISPECIES: GNAT family N-acetyltransferase [unclassified Enterococcus]|uniref:GNAT family N-acetyltransferase n=1 Tax=unclassified Enterococcus TaxID=2608891 RepID=UPI001551E5D9|nr:MULTISPECIES: GNAT family N-acetyltransferase [unclassified Enterococcus]MBS7578145.1 GNAT family N-acetyltransferase [Enterococcus sp. MMGLQ5-2]MBS7584039.1 GNAT family N-acetyltransferase [Enterococcus sp. MMGLQ5-1]NPD11900.1 GNAT family N-acetyltransferase [Enterococcus sp. MMGLQ5-1]NPD37976.1 GNAT family N-acetyltransferase [Enterococcus sp. MMGLQ5-2]
MTNFETVIKTTEQLTPSELINLLKERTKVFVVEQNCPYQEVDDKDISAIHVFFKNKNQILAYARIVPFNQEYMSIGRVLVVKEYRQLKLGRKLFATAMDEVTKRFPKKRVKIQAQSYLEAFYASFGFKAVSDSYLEDGIPHLDMILQNK